MAVSQSTQKPFTLQDAPRIPARGGSTRIRRFDGLSRRTADWDGLRKDTQLWDDNADCVVHFYAFRTSQRGPSLRVPFEAIEKLNCSYLVNECLHLNNKPSPSPLDDDRSDSSYGSSLSSLANYDKVDYELYIPTPSSLNRDQAFGYHLITRNVIAYAVGKPLVGEKLSSSLTGVWQRLNDWLPRPSLQSEFTAYLEEQGYLRFAENSEHALACLKFAEDARLRDVWINSFTHCVGMHERLDLSPEFAGLKNKTIALITRASLEMDLHIVRIGRAIGSFLEEEMGPVFLGLSKPARDHLDHFRSFLHSYYVDKLGYFPPSASKPWAKRPWKAMYHDFSRLYDYLVDIESTSDLASTRGMTGGICVVQNVQAFDLRHGYSPLAHPLPLLPQVPLLRRQSLSSQKGLLTLKLGRTISIAETKITPNQALAVATNCLNEGVISCSLVQEYQKFERQKLEGKLDVTEARKVRWLLVYGVLQMLTSIMKAPKEVRETDNLSYPLCVLTIGCPSWTDYENAEHAEASAVDEPQESSLVPDALDALEGRSARISIHPDCEADSADDFFAATAISRSESMMSLSATPAPLRVTTQPTRTASFRSSVHSSVHALHKSVVDGLNRRGSIVRRESVKEPRKVRSHCEILIEHYGNGLRADEDNTPSATAVRLSDPGPPSLVNSLQDFDFDLPAAEGEPTLDTYQVESETGGLDYDKDGVLGRKPSDSSTISQRLPDSNRSSGYISGEDSDTDLSSLEGDSDEQDGDSCTPNASIATFGLKSSTKPRQLCYRPSNPNFGVHTACFSVSAGCYTPSGMIGSPVSRWSSAKTADRRPSFDSVASSVYEEETVQAADIEEEEMRGRRRSRALDTLSHYGVVTGDGDQFY